MKQIPPAAAMSSGTLHHQLAEEALRVAERLHAIDPVWALVPLFYSAMHLVHARFDVDQISEHQRHPKRHRSRRDPNGTVLEWGTQDVVAALYRDISTHYRSLSSASRAVRYQGLRKCDTTRFWAAYDLIAGACGTRSGRL